MREGVFRKRGHGSSHRKHCLPSSQRVKRSQPAQGRVSQSEGKSWGRIGLGAKGCLAAVCFCGFKHVFVQLWLTSPSLIWQAHFLTGVYTTFWMTSTLLSVTVSLARVWLRSLQLHLQRVSPHPPPPPPPPLNPNELSSVPFLTAHLSLCCVLSPEGLPTASGWTLLSKCSSKSHNTPPHPPKVNGSFLCVHEHLPSGHWMHYEQESHLVFRSICLFTERRLGDSQHLVTTCSVNVTQPLAFPKECSLVKH